MSTYSTKPTTFEALVAPFSDDLQAVAHRLRALVFDASPDVEEEIYEGAMIGNALYSLGGPKNVLCAAQPGDDGCRFYVHHVKRFDHPSLKLEGKGKNSRHVKFYALDDIDLEAVRWLLVEARRAGGLMVNG